VVTLSASEVERFVADGFVKIDHAFPRETANLCRDIAWRQLGLSPDAPQTWTEPVLRLNLHAPPPVREAAFSERLRGAFDQLVGAGRWALPDSFGSTVVRFPSDKPPGDDGWHIDASIPPDNDAQSLDYFQWRVNHVSRNRSMLVLFLFSDCGPDDAPTRVRIGSHLPMARQLMKHGEAGISLADLANEGFESSADCEVALATGEAGTVWLLHPFTVHAAQAHRGTRVRFLSQPGLGFREPAQLERTDGGYSPVEQAIKLGLGR